ncbi:MAG: Ig-like domain repeat protein, partial [Eubacterium sp.]
AYKVQGSSDSTYTEVQPKNVGSYTLRATFGETDHYTEAVATADFEIKASSLNLRFDDKTVTYDTKDHSLSVVGTIPDGCTVTYEPVSARDAGVHEMKAIISGQGFETKTLTANLTITAAVPTLILKPEADKEIKVGDPITLTAEITGVGGEVPTGSVTALGETVELKAGKATFSYTPVDENKKEITAVYTPDTQNYKGATATCELTVGKRTRADISCEAVTATYGDTDSRLSPTGGSLQSGEAYTYAVKTGTDVVTVDKEGKIEILKAGNGVITVSLAESDIYNAASCDVVITVEKAEITGVTYVDQSVTWDGEAHSLVLTGELPEGATVAYENNTHKDSGTYLVKAMIDGGTNYKNMTLSANLIIGAKPDDPVKPDPVDPVNPDPSNPDVSNPNTDKSTNNNGTTQSGKTIVNPITGQAMSASDAALQGGAVLVIIGLLALAGWQVVKKRK